MENNKTQQEYGWQLSVKIISLLIALFFVIWFIHKIFWVISLIITATLIVYSISPLVNYLTKKGLPHFFSVLSVYFCLLLSIILFFYLLVPTLLEEMQILARYLATDYSYLLPQALLQLDQLLASENIHEALQDLANSLPAMLQQAVMTMRSITGTIFSGLTEVIIILLLVYHLLRDLSPIKREIIRLFPGNWRKEAEHVLDIIDKKVGAYLRGNILRCSFVGLFTGLAMAVAGMPFALILGILAGLLNIFVFVGPYIASIPAVLLSLSPGTPHPVAIIAIYVFVQVLDDFLLVPLLLGKAVDLRPFTVIVSLLIGGQLLGILGVILALPAAATLKVIVHHYYLKEDPKAETNRLFPWVQKKRATKDT